MDVEEVEAEFFKEKCSIWLWYFWVNSINVESEKQRETFCQDVTTRRGPLGKRLPV